MTSTEPMTNELTDLRDALVDVISTTELFTGPPSVPVLADEPDIVSKINKELAKINLCAVVFKPKITSADSHLLHVQIGVSIYENTTLNRGGQTALKITGDDAHLNVVNALHGVSVLPTWSPLLITNQGGDSEQEFSALFTCSMFF